VIISLLNKFLRSPQIKVNLQQAEQFDQRRVHRESVKSQISQLHRLRGKHRKLFESRITALYSTDQIRKLKSEEKIDPTPAVNILFILFVCRRLIFGK